MATFRCAVLLLSALLAPSYGQDVTTCGVNVELSEDLTPTCSSTCVSDEMYYTGLGYQQFSDLAALDLIVELEYQSGELVDCTLVALATDDEIAADQLSFQSCISSVSVTTTSTLTTLETTSSTTTTTSTSTTTTTTTTDAPDPYYFCPDDFTQVEETYCYYAPSNSLSWTNAKSFCEDLGAHLLRIDSSVEQSYAATQVSSVGSTVWLDINDQDEEDTFVYSDGTSSSYDNWEDGEPNNGKVYWWMFTANEDCVEMSSSSYTWNDEGCWESNRFICETEASVIYI